MFVAVMYCVRSRLACDDFGRCVELGKVVAEEERAKGRREKEEGEVGRKGVSGRHVG